MAYNGVVTADMRAKVRELSAGGGRGCAGKPSPRSARAVSQKTGLSVSQVRRILAPEWRVAQIAAENVSPAPNHFASVSVKLRVPRSVRRILAPRENISSAARAFAAGEISRSELMMRITP